ncbi:MAG: seg [Candidatus Campbellbacteria bacterium GW2011_OD1_34_28]|nr:MAG: seg [Candidatus Campbellbacteria bacterium GW2011_OD1_34_28]
MSLLKTKNSKLKTDKGFLLVEVIVAVALFSVVMTVGIVALLSLVQANERSQRFKIVSNNLNLALESISKEIRVGTGFTCDADCSGDTAFSFTSKDNEVIIYRLSTNDRIERSVDGGPFIDITAEDIVIDKMEFYVRGNNGTDGFQPKVEIYVSGYSGERDLDRMRFDLQTIVSQRTIMD